MRVAKVLKNLQMTTMVELLAVGALCRLKIALQDRSSLLGQLERMHRVVFDTSEHLRRFVGPHLSEGPSVYLLDRRLRRTEDRCGSGVKSELPSPSLQLALDSFDTSRVPQRCQGFTLKSLGAEREHPMIRSGKLGGER